MLHEPVVPVDPAAGVSLLPTVVFLWDPHADRHRQSDERQRLLEMLGSRFSGMAV